MGLAFEIPKGDLTAPLVVHRRGESDLHREIKSAAARWLFSCGLRQVATEVQLGVGVIDAAGSGDVSRTSAKKLGAWVHPGRFGSNFVSVVIEVKATRSDHLRDAYRPDLPLLKGSTGKYAKLQASDESVFRYVAAPPGVVKPGEVPPGWGILVYQDGAIKRASSSAMFPVPEARSRRVGCAIAETWTRSAFFGDLRVAQRELSKAARSRKVKRVACRACAKYTGPTRRSRAVPAPVGACSVPEMSIFKIRPTGLSCGGRNFEARV